MLGREGGPDPPPGDARGRSETRAKEMQGNSLRHPSQSCLAGHDHCPRVTPFPSQSSAGRAHGRSRRALKPHDDQRHTEVVALNGFDGSNGLSTGTGPPGLGTRLHPACLDAGLVLPAQPSQEPGHGVGAVACSAGVGEEGLPPPVLCTPVSQHATMPPLRPGAAPSPSSPWLHPAQTGDCCPCQLELIP